jgi:hypothetical protein
MQVFSETIGDTTIFIQAIEEDADDKVEIIGETWGGRATQLTGISDEVRESYVKIRSAIKNIAEDIGSELKGVQAAARPKQVEVEFNVGISAEVGPIFIMSSKGEYGLKVKMTWELGPDGRSG